MAVKKDRAAEPLLSPGAKFIVNIMAEGHERPLMKQLLKPFKPGEDRFAGLDIEVQHLYSPPHPILIVVCRILCARRAAPAESAGAASTA